ncbi:rhodanese domain-containing protein CG4456 [Drosophila busckii]|uniref:rhodanese domain-containing protein CG4456 n=1 Tax=Drosophila busckii TaxID=30019 RepID=UPI00083F2094|nr:rhodanese domain-containing protein CG4456 [Drosophila busckii]
MATYEQVKDVVNHPEIYLIDVRNQSEIAETGSIPASFNIPLPELSTALALDEQTFKTNYGRDKPALNADIIFTCRSGRRAQEAANIAQAAGFTNVRVYAGSWLEWAEKEGLKN